MSSSSATESPSLSEQAYQALLQTNYGVAAQLYEQAIAVEPGHKALCWYLGLTFLLQGQEEEAQMTWFLGMAEAEAEQVQQWTADLIEVLDQEAERQISQVENLDQAWLIRQHLRELAPEDLNNSLRIILLAIQRDTFSGEDLQTYQLIDLLAVEPLLPVDFELLLQTIQSVLMADPAHSEVLAFLQSCLPHVVDADRFVNLVLTTILDIGYARKLFEVAVRLTELALQVQPTDLRLLGHLATLCLRSREYEKSIAVAKQFQHLAQTLPGKIYGSFLTLRSLMISGGSWSETYVLFDQYKVLLKTLIEQHPNQMERDATLSMLTSTFSFPYLQDDLAENRWFHNAIGDLCQTNIQAYGLGQAEHYRQHHQARRSSSQEQRPLKIGYISSCLSQHSVGWLARWIFQYHDRDRYQTYTYLVNQAKESAFTQLWFADQVDQIHYLGVDGLEIAEQIYRDQVDILIDLDSITLDVTCEVMATKPAPVQATWLGWDAAGIPAVDYFIADPYVLPESAQEFYSETIWRLPQTYIAVQGFEIGVPTLRRDSLDIPESAVIYLSSQQGHKRHPDTARRQMQIIKGVPNSYFLIKGMADETSLKAFFDQLAEEEGVDPDRLRFLPPAASEVVHRANLGIADVVLDTYPYNGATTTLETLWMGIPMVTQVGQHFSSRNSYTMMMNAGITEGIAWSAEEYVEWGIRLGQDAPLRQQVAWKLRQSRQTAPLWNAKAFTQELERAYDQMWARYLAG